MKSLLVLCVHLAAVYVTYGLDMKYRKEERYMIGAILPLTKPDVNGSCNRVNAEGVALAESIVFAINTVNGNDRGLFKELLGQTTSIGYDIQDNCGDAEKTNLAAFGMASDAVKYGVGSSTKIPVRVVISAFPKSSTKNLPVLNSQGISQISYSRDNARLTKDASITADKISNLISMYPGASKKIVAVADFIRRFQFSYVHAVAANNDEGAKSLSLLASELKKDNICKSKNLFASSASDAVKVMDTIAKNEKIRVVVLHCPKAVELAIYAEADKRNMTDLLFVSTQDWESDKDALKPFASSIEGENYFFYELNEDHVKGHLKSRTHPYRNAEWLRQLFTDQGGDSDCLLNTVPSGVDCGPAKIKVADSLAQHDNVAVYAYESVFAIAHALQQSQKEGISLLEAAKGLKVTIPSLRVNKIYISDELAAQISNFKIFNVKGDSPATFATENVGVWNLEDSSRTPLKFFGEKGSEVTWKSGSFETPQSACSDSCAPGLYRKFKAGSGNCCWTCAKCPNGTASNITNSDKCLPCGEGLVVRPDQSGCQRYKLLYFNWGGPVGIIIVILMVVSIILVIFALCVFSHHNLHELVLNAGYNSLCLFLLACIVLIIVPIPLLIKPTMSSCFAYIILVNVAISVVLGILVSRSAYVNGLFDDNGELVKGSLGRYPRALVVILTVTLQIIVTVVAYNMEQLQTMHNETEKWNERFHECSTWASMTFWAGFIYNVVVSVVGNAMSCSSTKMEDNGFELKHVLQCHLAFYTVAIIELCVFFRSNDEHLAGGQGVICILYALGFYAFYMAPKIYIILFRSKGNKAIEVEGDGDEDGALMTTAVHASAGFRHHGIVQMKIRDED